MLEDKVEGAVKPKKAKRRPGRPAIENSTSKEESRRQLERIALGIFAEHGYDAVSTGDVARAANLSQPMIHYHFGSKEKLWEAAMIRLFRDLGERFPLDSSMIKDLGPVDKLKVITRRFILMSASDPTLSKIILGEGRAHTSRMKWLVENYIRRGYSEFDNAIQDGIDQGLVRDFPVFMVTNALITASAFVFCCDAMIEDLYGIKVTDKNRVEELSDGIIDIMFNGILQR